MTTITRIESIKASLLTEDAKVMLPAEEGGMVEGLIFSIDDLCETIVIWYTTGPVGSHRYECDPETTFELIAKAPTQMTLPELVREFVSLRVEIALGKHVEQHRLMGIVGELKSRGGLD